MTTVPLDMLDTTAKPVQGGRRGGSASGEFAAMMSDLAGAKDRSGAGRGTIKQPTASGVGDPHAASRSERGGTNGASATNPDGAKTPGAEASQGSAPLTALARTLKGGEASADASTGATQTSVRGGPQGQAHSEPARPIFAARATEGGSVPGTNTDAAAPLNANAEAGPRAVSSPQRQGAPNTLQGELIGDNVWATSTEHAISGAPGAKTQPSVPSKTATPLAPTLPHSAEQSLPARSGPGEDGAAQLMSKLFTSRKGAGDPAAPRTPLNPSAKGAEIQLPGMQTLGAKLGGDVTVTRQETHFAPVRRPETLEAHRWQQQVGDTIEPVKDEMKKPSFTAVADQIRTALERAADPEARLQQQSAGQQQQAAQRAALAPLRIVELSLQPAALGAISVTMRLTGTGLRITVNATSRETAELLGEEREALAALMASAGYEAKEIVVSHRAETGTV